ncbi:MAG: hypothetical protein NTX50_28015 [Candidatus Sumerlaeota bacterium]|nr:hypothetical protein [Candidatus Sumerlaeota bacterium]
MTSLRVKYSPKHSRAQIVLVFFAIAAIYTLLLFSHSFDDDEFQHTHVAWLIWHGQTPYVDFFEHHLPLYHLLLSPLFGLGAGIWQIFAIRFISLLCALGTLVIVCRAIRREAKPADKTYDDSAATIVVLLLAAAPIFSLKMIEARPESPAILCFAGAVALALRLKKNPKDRTDPLDPSDQSDPSDPANPPPKGTGEKWIVFVAGLLLGAAGMLSQKYAFAAAGLLVCVAMIRGAAEAGIMVLGMAATAIIPFAWLAASGALGAAYQHVFALNAGWKREVSPAGYLFEAFETSGALVALGVVGLLAPFVRLESSGGWRRAAGMLALFAGALTGVLISPVPYRQSFLPLYIILAFGAASLLRVAVEALGSGGGAKACLVVFLLSAILPGAGRLIKDCRESPAQDIATMRKVEAIDPDDGPVFDGRGLMYYRSHVGRYGCMHAGILAMIDQERYAKVTIAMLEALDYPTVIRDYRVQLMPAAIQTFIEEHYRPVAGTDILTPGLAMDRSRLSPQETDFEIPASGQYRVSYAAGKVFIDGQEIAGGAEIVLKKGRHQIRAEGFVEALEFVLVKRAQ